MLARVLVVVMFACGLAAADDRDDAKREFAAGQASDRQHDPHGAIEHYLRAYELYPHAFALYNIAADYDQLGDVKQAMHFYEKYIAETTDNADRERVKKILAELKARPGAVTIHTFPDGARLNIDGKDQGTTPFSGMLRGGHHTVTVEYEGQRQQRDILVELGQPVEETIRFGAQQGMIQVTGAPVGAQVSIDNVPVGVIPARVPEPAGEHAIRVVQMGFAPFETTAMVQPGSTTEVHANLVPGDSSNPGLNLARSLPQIYYLFGFGGGMDVDTTGAYIGFDFGVATKRVEALFSIGKTHLGSSVDAQVRYYFLPWVISPFIGAGYSYVQNGAGWELTGGLRGDLVRHDHFGAALIAQFAVRWYAATDGNPDADPPITAHGSGVFLPITVSLDLFWR